MKKSIFFLFTLISIFACNEDKYSSDIIDTSMVTGLTENSDIALVLKSVNYFFNAIQANDTIAIKEIYLSPEDVKCLNEKIDKYDPGYVPFELKLKPVIRRETRKLQREFEKSLRANKKYYHRTKEERIDIYINGLNEWYDKNTTLEAELLSTKISADLEGKQKKINVKEVKSEEQNGITYVGVVLDWEYENNEESFFKRWKLLGVKCGDNDLKLYLVEYKQENSVRAKNRTID